MIIRTGKYLNEEINARAQALADVAENTPGIVLTDRGGRMRHLLGMRPGAPLTEPEIAKIQMHRLVNGAAVDAGLAAAEEFIDDDGDAAINHYGVDFATREILFWDRHAGQVKP